MVNIKSKIQQKKKNQENTKKNAQTEIDIKASEDKISDQSELIKQLMEAAKGDDVTTVEHLIKEEKVGVDSFDHRGHTALHYASEYGKIDVVKKLLTLNADINIPEKITNMSPLRLAINYNQYLVVKELLLHDSSCYLESHENGSITPLATAAFNMEFDENWEMVRLLLQTHKKLDIYTAQEVVENIEDAFSCAVDREYAEYSYLDKYKNIVSELGVSDLQQCEL